jgi:hypothetical protein
VVCAQAMRSLAMATISSQTPVDVGLPGGEVVQAGVLCVADAVLDAGVGAVPRVQRGEVPGGGVGGEGLDARGRCSR